MKKAHDQTQRNQKKASLISILRYTEDELTDKRMYRVKSASKGLVEYVAYSSSST